MENLKDQMIWACWRGDKKPRNPLTDNYAKSNDPSTWCEYSTCVSAVEAGDYDGYGIMCSDTLVFIDIDHCVYLDDYGNLQFEDTPTGNLPAINILEKFDDTYVELSKSNTGIHIICRGNLTVDKSGMRAKGVELYKSQRFLIITENTISDTLSVNTCQDALDWLVTQLTTVEEKDKPAVKQYGKCENVAEVLEKAMEDVSFRDYYVGKRPYEDESSNDYGFITKLCFYFNRDPDTAYQILLDSPYFRSKDTYHQSKMAKRFDTYFLPTFDSINNQMETVYGESTVTLGTTATIPGAPTWLEKGTRGAWSINEILFAQQFMEEQHLHYINCTFFDDRANTISETEIKQKIQQRITPYFTSGVARRVVECFNVIVNEAFEKDTTLNPRMIYLSNGNLQLKGFGEYEFIKDDSFTLHRLPTVFDVNARCPVWKQFISELFYEEDIPVVQEYLGYLLVPTTKAQCALFILGNGGEGKSRIIRVVSELLGNKATPIELANISTDKFFAAQIENSLCAYDDDCPIDKIERTDLFKKIITADAPMRVEQKYKETRSVYLHSRILACSNAAFSSKFDRTDGFYRRLMQVVVRPLNPNRKNNAQLSDMLSTELSGIFNWCLEGLLRLDAQNYIFTRSSRIDKFTQQLKEDNDSVLAYLNSGAVHFKQDAVTATKDLYKHYCEWCNDEGHYAINCPAFSKRLSLCASTFNMYRAEHIIRNGKHARGYRGVELADATWYPETKLEGEDEDVSVS